MNFNFNINQFIADFTTNCSRKNIKTFSKGEVITSYIQKRQQFCILLDGSANLIRYDLNGNRIIIDHFSKNDIFGEVFYNITTNNELFVEAKQKSSVLFFNYNNIYSKCKNNCKFHATLASSFDELILDKITDLNMRIELLSKRSIREKLLSYFNLLSTKKLNKSFTIPFSLTDLADYLCVDRSAMMREMKLLKEEGFLKKTGNRITLLQQ